MSENKELIRQITNEVAYSYHSRPFEIFFAWPMLVFYLAHIIFVVAAIPMLAIEHLPASYSSFGLILTIVFCVFSINWLRNRSNNIFYKFIVIVALIYNLLLPMAVFMLSSRNEELGFFSELNTIWSFFLIFYVFSYYYHKWIFNVYLNR